MNILKKLVHAFNTHPEVSQFHMTCDGQLFVLPTDAEAHSKNCERKEIVTLKRDEVENCQDELDLSKIVLDRLMNSEASDADQAKETPEGEKEADKAEDPKITQTQATETEKEETTEVPAAPAPKTRKTAKK